MARKGVRKMAIAWKALPVVEHLDKVSGRLDEIEPLLAEAKAEVRMARQGRNLPDYLTQRLSGLEGDLGHLLTRCRSRVESVRKAIPADAIEQERNRPPQLQF